MRLRAIELTEMLTACRVRSQRCTDRSELPGRTGNFDAKEKLWQLMGSFTCVEVLVADRILRRRSFARCQGTLKHVNVVRAVAKQDSANFCSLGAARRDAQHDASIADVPAKLVAGHRG